MAMTGVPLRAIDATLTRRRASDKFREVQWSHLPAGEARRVCRARASAAVGRRRALDRLRDHAPAPIGSGGDCRSRIHEPSSMAVLLPCVTRSHDEEDE